MANRQQGDFVIELDQRLDDHLALAGAPAFLRISPGTLDIVFASQQRLALARRTHDRLDDIREADLPGGFRESVPVFYKRILQVGSFSSSAARRRMPSRFIVRCAAFALGTMVNPCCSSSINPLVAMASISGTIKAGFSVSAISFNADASSIEMQ